MGFGITNCSFKALIIFGVQKVCEPFYVAIYVNHSIFIILFYMHVQCIMGFGITNCPFKALCLVFKCFGTLI